MSGRQMWTGGDIDEMDFILDVYISGSSYFTE